MRPYTRLLKVSVPVAAAAIVFMDHPSRACGVPPPGSPPGFHCGETDTEETKFRTSASYTFSSTRLVFSGERKADVARQIAGLGVSYRASKLWSAQLSLGAITSGTMSFVGSSHRFNAGLSIALSASYRMLEENPKRPFAILTGTFGYAAAKTQEPARASVAYNAFDLRLGAAVGKTFADLFAVYLTARVFGGPIFWKLRDEAVTGTDLYKYQLGMGASVSPLKHVDLFIEGIPVGERALSFGGGVSY
jgi:hypothetical protein